MDFREIAVGGEAARTERLFRASVAAFCSLTRPTRREITQLEQLTAPLFDRVSDEARRFVAAALSDSPYAPHELVLRLASQRVEIGAPLLMRSPVLTDVDLVGLIARCGLPHARVIARRRGLNPAIGRLVTALSAATSAGRDAASLPSPSAADTPADVHPANVPIENTPAEAQQERSEEQTRAALRAIMGGQQAPRGRTSSFAEIYRSAQGTQQLYDRLKETLVAENGAAFRSALAAATGIDELSARTIVEARDFDDLMATFRHLGFVEEQAFLLLCVAAPGRFATPQAIRAFLESFRGLARHEASQRIASWQAETERRRRLRTASGREGAPAPSDGGGALRAS